MTGILEIALIIIGAVVAIAFLGLIIGFENLLWLGAILDFISDFWD